MRRYPVIAWLAFLAALVSGCGGRDPRPNVVWVVWDTVRADRMGLYGCEKATTPFVDAWAAEARVFDDCVSPANYTVASHASLFTGLAPTEHGVRNGYLHLDDRFDTVAEILRRAGYRTYVWSANPHISKEENFTQGFDAEEHPWDPAFLEDAIRIVRAKIDPGDRSSELPAKFRRARVGSWDIKASGELAGRAALAWLRRSDRSRPFFVFLNYMEAHRPYIPPAAYRHRVMSDEAVRRSYLVDRSWVPLWSYTFGLHDYSDEDLAVMAGKYEATVAELDDLFRALVDSLGAAGFLENTTVILTSDHGEQLGGHHMLGHQYSLYEPLVRVPLVIRDAARFPPGREERPVMTHDLFPTILEIAGIRAPERESGPVSLRSPRSERVRVAECPGVFRDPFPAVARAYPGFDPTPWEREIRAIYHEGMKLIRWDDGTEALYEPATDPAEEKDRKGDDPERAARLGEVLDAYVAIQRARRAAPEGTPPELPAEHLELLRSLGYVEGGEETTAVEEP